MNLIAWVLSLSVLVWLMIQAVDFHRATICRQKAWLKSTELITRSKLSRSTSPESAVDLDCRLFLTRSQDKVLWRQGLSLKQHTFTLELVGDL